MRYPPAIWKGDGASGGSYVHAGRKVVLHTTETGWLPSYKGGMSAPHLTYAPSTRLWVQHTDLSTAARSLRNAAGGAQTNRANAYQVEIICYSAKWIADQKPARLWVGDLPATTYDDLRDFIEWSGINPVWPGRQAFSYTEANAPGFRMGAAEWTAYAGIVGHQHVPENTHWDPGALDWVQLLRQKGAEMSFSKGLTEPQWRALYQAGIAKGSSEQAVIDYWMTLDATGTLIPDPARIEAEHDNASASMFTELAVRRGISEADAKALIEASRIIT